MSPTARPIPLQRSAWREPMVWLVVAGPAIVVVAGIVTAVIAHRGADLPLPPPSTQATSPAAQPAMKARNHAATPQAPAR